MNFGEALQELKFGHKVARSGWNGKGMFLFLVPGSTFKVNRAPLMGIYPEGTEITYQPHIDMKTANGSVVPWLASQTDLLSNDWEIVVVATSPKMTKVVEADVLITRNSVYWLWFEGEFAFLKKDRALHHSPAIQEGEILKAARHTVSWAIGRPLTFGNITTSTVMDNYWDGGKVVPVE